MATVRPVPTAASITCWMRWMWLAKAPTITLRPSSRPIASRSTSPTSRSDRVDPGSSALVESASSSRTPGSSASAPMRDSAVRRPSTGVRSSLKSLECRIRPCGVENAVMKPPGTEWVTGMASHSKGPALKRSPSRTSRSSARSSRPASVSLCRTRPSVKRRSVHRERQALEQVRQGADVVLMGVGGDTGLHAPAVQQPFEIGQHRVHAGKVVPCEHPAAVEQHAATGGLDDRAVASDLPEAAQEGDGYRRGHS